MLLDIHFTEEEKLSFLRNLGYTVQKEDVEYSFAIYHGKSEDRISNMWVVRNGYGEEIYRPWDYGMYDWLNNAFNIEFSNKLKKMILS